MEKNINKEKQEMSIQEE